MKDLIEVVIQCEGSDIHCYLICFVFIEGAGWGVFINSKRKTHL